VGLAVRIVARCLTEPARQRRRVALRGQSDQGRTRWVTAYAGGHNHQTMCVRHQTSWSAAPCTDRGWPRPRSPGLADKGCPGLGQVAPDSGLIRSHKGSPGLANHVRPSPDQLVCRALHRQRVAPASLVTRPVGLPGRAQTTAGPGLRAAPASCIDKGWPRHPAAGWPRPRTNCFSWRGKRVRRQLCGLWCVKWTCPLFREPIF